MRGHTEPSCSEMHLTRWLTSLPPFPPELAILTTVTVSLSTRLLYTVHPRLSLENSSRFSETLLCLPLSNVYYLGSLPIICKD